eukprot:3741313-Amphidinium_carterae.1
MKPGDLVLDYGSGCGFMLSWLHAFYGIEGFGIVLSLAKKPMNSVWRMHASTLILHLYLCLFGHDASQTPLETPSVERHQSSTAHALTPKRSFCSPEDATHQLVAWAANYSHGAASKNQDITLRLV